MTKEGALYDFFSHFGMDAYANTAVPDDAAFPYLTYTTQTDSFSGLSVSLTVQIWDRASEEEMNSRAREIAERIGYGGKLLACDGGYIYLTRGTPFSIGMSAEGDNRIKMRQMNVNARYLTED